jgi:hypothetical protein
MCAADPEHTAPKDPFNGVVRVRLAPVATRPATRLEERTFACALVATGVVLGTVFTFQAVAGYLPAFVALTIPPLVAFWLASFGARRLGLAHLRKHDWLICPACRYSLDTLPPDSRCPECGGGAKSDEVRAAWRSFYFTSPRAL